MSISQVLKRDPVKLSPEDTVARAARLLTEENVLALPVVKPNGELAGMFGLHELVGLLMPRAVTMGYGLDSLADIDFVTDTLEDIRQRMDDVGRTTVGDHLEPDSSRTPLDPDSSFTEVLFLVYRLRRDLPVVEKETGRLAGMVSPWDVLERLG